MQRRQRPKQKLTINTDDAESELATAEWDSQLPFKPKTALQRFSLAALQCVLCAVIVWYTLRDLFVAGLNTSNGRVTSFCDSLNNCFQFRQQRLKSWPSPRKAPMGRRAQSAPPSTPRLYFAGHEKSGIAWQAYLGFMCAFLKFGAGTTVSLVLHETPVLLRGIRHMFSFAAALLLIQSCPGDVCNTCLNGPLHLVVCAANALYKVRKFTFALEASLAMKTGSTGTALLVTWLAVEGSSASRRIESIFHRYMCANDSTVSSADVVRDVAMPILRMATPVLLLAIISRFMLVTLGAEAQAYAACKIVVFTYLLYRYLNREWRAKAKLSLFLHPRGADDVDALGTRERAFSGAPAPAPVRCNHFAK